MTAKTKESRGFVSNAEMLNAEPEALIAWFDDFDGSHDRRFLSNFYIGDSIKLDLRWGDVWGRAVCLAADVDPDAHIEGPTGEHVYAAFKAATIEDFIDIMYATDKHGNIAPGVCKSRGRKCKLRLDWEEIKYDVMAMVLRCKFTLERPEGQMLLDTGDALLIEGTEWNDRVWGVALPSRGKLTVNTAQVSPGRNWLGTLLMARRAELRAEKFFGVVTGAGQSNQIFVR